MCGIVAGFVDEAVGDAGLHAIAHRGPDGMGMAVIDELYLGHARLAIIDPTPASNQPFKRGKITLVYSGEIWNYKALRAQLEATGKTFTTSGDTEVVAEMLDAFGINALIQFQGMFAMAWIDGKAFWAARDRFGEVPLHVCTDPFVVASEIKALLAMGCSQWDFLEPGGLFGVDLDTGAVLLGRWYDLPADARDPSVADAATEVFALLKQGVVEREISDVPVCCLVSGGIDSSAILWLLASRFKSQGKQLAAFTAVFNEGSRDLRLARQLCKELNVKLFEVKVQMPTRADLSRVVTAIEMASKAQVEIGWPCLKLAEAMKAEGFKVTFSGEGSDELWASYGFAYHALKTKGWHEYRRMLFLGQHAKNFARANKVFMAKGVECRLPFLNTGLVEYALSLSRTAVKGLANVDKYVMKEAFAGVLPAEIVARPKVAFQDGMGIKRAIQAQLLNGNARTFYQDAYRDFIQDGRQLKLW